MGSGFGVPYTCPPLVRRLFNIHIRGSHQELVVGGGPQGAVAEDRQEQLDGFERGEDGRKTGPGEGGRLMGQRGEGGR